jgi:hypothetical protein
MAYYTPKQCEELYYAYVLKAKEVIRKSLKHKDKQTRLHYELMYHKLENALE